VDHTLCEVSDSEGFVSVCGCGWSSVTASTEDHAYRRWKIHASQQRSAELCAHAWTVGATTQARALELVGVREAARERRSKLAQRRQEVRIALEVAGRGLRALGPSVEHTLECARELSGMSMMDLWLQYLSYGGDMSLNHLQLVMDGEEFIGQRDYEVVSTVLNEAFRDAGFGNPLPIAMRR
jgi:hypothetical protein